MANFGDNLRNWLNDQPAIENKKVLRVINEEWEKATKKLIESTPNGTIRVTNFYTGSLMFRIKLRTLFIYEPHAHFFLSNKFTEYPFYTTAFDCWYIGVPDKVLLFYANDPKSNPNCANDLIIYWFEKIILPEYEEYVKREYKYSTSSINTKYSLENRDIKATLENFNIKFDKNDYETTITALCDKHGITLTKSSDNYFYISL